jgi:hypothetical protein
MRGRNLHWRPVSLATDRRVGDDRVVPHCYYVVSRPSTATASNTRISSDGGGTTSGHGTSPLTETGNDIVQCVEGNSRGLGKVRRLSADGKKIRASVFFVEWADAIEYLSPIMHCLEVKGYDVMAALEASYEELDLNVPGYTPRSDLPAE